ncbi:MAG: transporter [Acidobacteriota bacterium]
MAGTARGSSSPVRLLVASLAVRAIPRSCSDWPGFPSGRAAHRRLRAAIWLGVASSFAVPLPAQIIAPAGRTLFNQAVMVRSVFTASAFDEPAPGADVHQLALREAVIWGATPRLTFTVVTPVIEKKVSPPGFAGIDRRLRGTGDTSLFARFDAWKKNVPRGSTRLTPEFGLTLPTGGAFSDGSTDLSATLIFSHVRDPHWLVADVQVTRNGNGDGDLRQGTQWRVDLAYLNRLLPRRQMGTRSLYLVAELNATHQRGATRGGADLSDSGGSLLRFSPGLEFFLNRRVVIEQSISIPVARSFDGQQVEPDITYLAGLRWLF